MSVFTDKTASTKKPDLSIEPYAKGREPVPTNDKTNSVRNLPNRDKK